MWRTGCWAWQYAQRLPNIFPIPNHLRKAGKARLERTSGKQKSKPNPYQPIIDWFGKGNDLMLLQSDAEAAYVNHLYAVDGLYACVKQFYPDADEAQAGLLMEFLLHGLSEYSLISKKGVEKGGYSFGDILGSMLNMTFNEEDES